LGKAYPENKVHSVASLLVVLSVPSPPFLHPSGHPLKKTIRCEREHLKIIFNQLDLPPDIYRIKIIL